MNAAVLRLMAEKIRRDRRRDQMHEAIAKNFTFVEHRRWEPSRGAPRVRRLDVYAAVADALGVLVPSNDFFSLVRAACVEKGAIPTRPSNVKHMAFMAPRTVVRRPEIVSLAEQRRLRAEWERRLADSGFIDMEKTRANDGSDLVKPRYVAAASINGAFFEQAQQLYWRMDRDIRVWELYAIDGLSIRDVGHRLGLGHDAVHRITLRLRKAMDGHSPHDEDDDGDEAND